MTKIATSPHSWMNHRSAAARVSHMSRSFRELATGGETKGESLGRSPGGCPSRLLQPTVTRLAAHHLPQADLEVLDPLLADVKLLDPFGGDLVHRAALVLLEMFAALSHRQRDTLVRIIGPPHQLAEVKPA